MAYSRRTLLFNFRTRGRPLKVQILFRTRGRPLKVQILFMDFTQALLSFSFYSPCIQRRAVCYEIVTYFVVPMKIYLGV